MGNRIEEINHALDMDEHISLHRKGWLAQYIGKALLVALMIAGILGLFGEGWLSKQTLSQGRTQITYERYARLHGQMQLKVSQAGVTGRSAISFPLSYTNLVQVTQVQPQPEQAFIRDGQLWYVFEADQNLMATFHIKPMQGGKLQGSVFVNEDNIPIHHFIYP